MSSVDLSKLVALAENSKAHPTMSSPQPQLLERFDNPMKRVKLTELGKEPSVYKGTINIEVSEFTSLCPLTRQPDFATIVIDYEPRAHCVESKSLKLYLMSFRNVGEFHEACVNRIAAELIALLDPLALTVEGRFTPRGGIPFWPKIEYVAAR